jgi:TonB-linked SusC/RagA family outer membrane protein
MKLTIILMLAVLLQVSAKGHAQTITISVKNASLEKVFTEIKKQTGYSFLYTDQTLQGTHKVDINVNAVSLETLLDLCLKNQPVTYTIVNKTIILKPRDESPKENATDEKPLLDISGRVTDPDGNPLAGATVKVKGSNKLTITNNDGVFVLKGVGNDAVLEISFVGYQTITVAVNNRTSVSASLKLNIISNPEVIVRKGYYNEKRATTTGNVSTVTSKDIEKQPVNNPLLALQGRIPGMFITQSTGLPGSSLDVQIRGQNSMANGNDPLYIIDGVPYTSQVIRGLGSYVLGSASGNPFSYINPADIESIDVLKDADATAIYGSRGANGVVLITTKKGKAGQMKVDINMQSGWGKVASEMKLLNTKQYLEMRHEAFKNDGAVPNPSTDFDLTLWDTTRNVDWQKELIGGTAHYYDVQASVSGGNLNAQYLIGSGYHKETTVFPGDFNDQKGSVHFNINGISNNRKFNILLSGIYTTDNNQLSGYDLTETALKLAPNAPSLYNPDGSINWALNASGISTWTGYNPAAQMLPKYHTRTNNLVSDATLSYIIIPGLEIKSSFGYTNLQTNEVLTIPLSFNQPAVRQTVKRRASFTTSNIHSWIVEPQIAYTKETGKGTITALVGATIQQNSGTGQTLDASGFNSDLVLEDIASATTVTPSTTSNSVYKYNAVFGRLNYNWQSKYLVNITARRDGSSRFGPSNQFHNFGAVGAGWVFSKETFIQKHIPFLSFGKVRGSYGSTGNDQVGDYTFLDQYSPVSFGVPYQGATGLTPTRIFTPDLAWEETKKLEGALELGFFKDRIILSASYYFNSSSNQLTGYNLPGITGFLSVEKNLPATVQNKGWEFEVRTVNINRGALRWTSSANVTLNRNKLASGAPGLSAYYQQKIGHPLQSRFAYHLLGVDPFSGLYQVADSHLNPVTVPNPLTDQTIIIDLTPKFYGGFQNSITYQRFQFDFLFQFVKQSGAEYLYNDKPGTFNLDQGYNQPVTVLNRWQTPGDVRPIQRFSQNGSVTTSYSYARFSDQAYGDASYIRLKNVSLSWSLPQGWKKNAHFLNGRVYIQGQNLLTFTDYKGLDPETKGSTNSISLPPLRVITVGIQVGF